LFVRLDRSIGLALWRRRHAARARTKTRRVSASTNPERRIGGASIIVAFSQQYGEKAIFGRPFA
jgi:hypothetical protein